MDGEPGVGEQGPAWRDQRLPREAAVRRLMGPLIRLIWVAIGVAFRAVVTTDNVLVCISVLLIITRPGTCISALESMTCGRGRAGMPARVAGGSYLTMW